MANTISPVRSNVPQPVFGDKGFVAPQETEILAGVQADFNASFGGNLNFTTTSNGITNPTPQGQLANSMTAILGNINDLFLKYQNMVDPAYSSGRMQDAIGRIYYIERFPSKPTVIQVNCIGLGGVQIPLDARIQDDSGNLYLCTAGGTINALTGSIILSFANQFPGPIALPSLVGIYQAIPGWDSVVIISGVVGNDIETRSDFESRRALSTAQNSMGMIPSIRGAIASLPDVIDVFCFENSLNDPLAIGGIIMPPNSIFVCVEGGDSVAIANEIWKKKMPGCAYYPGNVSIEIQDTKGYVAPFPTYTVTYQVPGDLQILMNVNLVDNQYVPAGADTVIKDAIINAFAGGDGLPRAKIAGELLASRYYEPVLACGTWVQILSIQIGSIQNATTRFGGSLFGNTLTVQTMIEGALEVGQTLFDETGSVIPGTVVTEFHSGTGGIGTYGISKTQTVPLELMYGVNADQFSILPDLDQIPTISVPLINVTLT